MSKTVSEIMAEKRAAGLEEIKALLWNGESLELVAEAAIKAGITEGEVNKLEGEINSIRTTLEAGNSINLAALVKAVKDTEKPELAAKEALDRAQAVYDDASRKAYDARNALHEGRQKVFFAAGIFSEGKAPKSVKPSPSVLAMAEEQRSAEEKTAKIEALKVKVRSLCEQARDIQSSLDAGHHDINKGGHNKAMGSLSKQLEDIEAEKKAALAEINKLS